MINVYIKYLGFNETFENYEFEIFPEEGADISVILATRIELRRGRETCFLRFIKNKGYTMTYPEMDYTRVKIKRFIKELEKEAGIDC